MKLYTFSAKFVIGGLRYLKYNKPILNSLNKYFDKKGPLEKCLRRNFTDHPPLVEKPRHLTDNPPTPSCLRSY